MAFDGTEGGQIPLTVAAEMTANYRHDYPDQRKAHFFGREILERILSQEGCMGIRMYYGLDDEGERELIIVGADVNENDMTELVADLSSPCPNLCSRKNQLNS